MTFTTWMVDRNLTVFFLYLTEDFSKFLVIKRLEAFLQIKILATFKIPISLSSMGGLILSIRKSKDTVDVIYHTKFNWRRFFQTLCF